MEIQHNFSLKDYNTFGIEAKAQYFIQINQLTDYDPQFLMDYEPITILGGGSNVLFLQDLPGLVMQVNILGKEIVALDEDSVILKIGAGENWHQLVKWTLEQGWSGIENLSLIPGTMGAAPMQNIGAYGVELADVLERVEGVFLADGTPFSISTKQCQLGYRNSIFKNAWKNKVLISQVYLKLSKSFSPNITYGAIQQVLDDRGITTPTARDVSDAVIQIRTSKLPDPIRLGNAGSFFKNPIIALEQFNALKKEHPEIPSYPAGQGSVKIPAGWLIEHTGWKGKKVGNTGTHTQQALVIVNYGNASGQEIFDLSESILTSVQEQFGILLEREVTVF